MTFFSTTTNTTVHSIMGFRQWKICFVSLLYFNYFSGSGVRAKRVQLQGATYEGFRLQAVYLEHKLLYCIISKILANTNKHYYL